jgi:ABC-2 type transport system permease protein
MSSPTTTAATGRATTESSGLLGLFRALLYKDVLLMVRYPVNTLAGFVALYAMFALIFYGGQAVAGARLADTIGGIVVGYFLWVMATMAYQGVANDVTTEAQWGTLEQLYMSPFGFGTVVVVKSVVNVLLAALRSAVILVLMLATTGESLSVAPLTVFPILVLTVASVVGFGFLFGGLALVYKRIGNVYQLLQFGFVGLIAAPATGIGWLRYLPLAHGSGMLQQAMTKGVALWAFPTGDLLLLVATALGYGLVGYLGFLLAARRARRLGVLGQY